MKHSDDQESRYCHSTLVASVSSRQYISVLVVCQCATKVVLNTEKFRVKKISFQGPNIFKCPEDFQSPFLLFFEIHHVEEILNCFVDEEWETVFINNGHFLKVRHDRIMVFFEEDSLLLSFCNKFSYDSQQSR